MTRSCQPPHFPEVVFAKADDMGAAGERCAQGLMLSPLIQHILVALSTCGCLELLLQGAPVLFLYFVAAARSAKLCVCGD